MHVAIVIPALDEEGSIGQVVRELQEAAVGCADAGGERLLCTVIVGDNGSVDETAKRAREAGAVVVPAPRRGYGSACLAALAALPSDAGLVLFADGDGADDPRDVPALLQPLLAGAADLVIGSRALGEARGLVEPGALTVPQRFGNRLATTLLRGLFGVTTTDLGPFRALRREALDALAMDDPDFGWTMQMQARAAARGLRSVDVPVRYRRRRTGRSKVAGDLKGSALAGGIILRTVLFEAARARRPGRP
jgi:glycosyltransferase involved in cell wall biosynthesis